MHFHLLLFNAFFLFVKGLRLQKVLFQYILLFVMMNLIAFIACFMFLLFLPKLIGMLGKQRKNNGLENFLLQDKQVYLRNVLSRQAGHLQEIARNSRFKAQKKLLQSDLFGFKIQG